MTLGQDTYWIISVNGKELTPPNDTRYALKFNSFAAAETYACKQDKSTWTQWQIIEVASWDLRTSLQMADMELELTIEKGECWLSITDTLTKEQIMFTCTPGQAAAIWALAINGDDCTEKLILALYDIAEPVVAQLPNTLRPIP